jgi:hypothetical protein
MSSAINQFHKFHDYLKNLAELQVEISRAVLPQPTSSSVIATETINTTNARREYLLKQSQVIFKTISEFNFVDGSDRNIPASALDQNV